jgi:lipopolysaccharide export system protein LptA
MRTIFISKTDYEGGIISQPLINHEIAHTRQLHSVDIIFVELISAVFWFNPVVYLYKRAVKLNHEYLADSFVLNSGYSVSDYSDMLLNFSSRGKYFNLISGINCSFLKKRLNMIIRANNLSHLKLKLFTAVIISAVLFFITGCTLDINSNRVPDPINILTTNNASGYRVNDTLMYYFGDFYILSGTSKTMIKAHRLKISNGLSPSKNYFENDFMSGKVYSDGVDINTKSLFLDRIISYKANEIKRSSNPETLNLIGQAEIKGDDVVITADKITLYLE